MGYTNLCYDVTPGVATITTEPAVHLAGWPAVGERPPSSGPARRARDGPGEPRG